MLLQRLVYKDQLREQAACMLSSAYRLKLVNRAEDIDEKKRIL